MHLLQTALAVPLLAVAVSAQGTAGPYGQCGGIGYSGPSACGAGYGCTSYNPYYFQCVPGGPTATTTTTTTTSTTTTTPTSKTTLTTTTRGTTTTPIPTTTTAPGNGGGNGTPLPTTLLQGYSWIRAVASPNFHSYLQAAPTSTPLPAPALLTSNTSAGQFRLVSGGQLELNRGSGNPPLYMHVENPADKTQRKLKTWFDTTQNTYGTFAFQGDTLTWSVPEIQRPNEAAWLVCTGQEVFVNTGAYLYQTPEGCFDQTIHSYGGSTADV